MDPSLLARKERGDTKFRADELEAIAKSLGIETKTFGVGVFPRDSAATGGKKLIPVINRAPAGAAMSYDTDHYDEFGTAFHYIDRGDINDDLAFAVQIVGTSMEPTLHAGDLVVMLPVTEESPRESQLAAGAIVFVRFSNDTDSPGVTVARWQPGTNGSVVLAKDNPASPPIIVKREAIVRLAVAVEVRRKLS